MIGFIQKDMITLHNIPLGTGLAQRTLLLARDGLTAGLMMGIYDCLLGKQFTSFLQITNRCAYWVVPFAAMGATYAFASDISCRIRGKSDHVNTLLGAIPVGYIVQRWTKQSTMTRGYFAAVMVGVSILAANTTQKHSWEPQVRTKRSVAFAENYYTLPDGTIRRHWEM